MRFDELKKEVKSAKKRVISSEKEYLKFLKVVGNNHKYNLESQLSIYNHFPEAKACAKYDYWKSFGYAARKGSKGIPAIVIENGRKTIRHIFDMSQLDLPKESKKDIARWELESKDYHILNEVSYEITGIKSADLVENLSAISSTLKLTEEAKNFLNRRSEYDFSAFITESYKVALSYRLGIKYEINHELLLEGIKEIDEESFTMIATAISQKGKLAISEIIRRSSLIKDDKAKEIEKTIESSKEEEKKVQSEVVYNAELEQSKAVKNIENEENKDENTRYKYTNRRVAEQRISVRGGLQRFRFNRRDSGLYGEKDIRAVSNDGGKSDFNIRTGKAPVSFEQFADEFLHSSGLISRGRAVESRSSDRAEIEGLHRGEDEKDDDRKEHNRRVETVESGGIQDANEQLVFDFGGSSTNRDSGGGLRVENEREAEDASFFSGKKEDSNRKYKLLDPFLIHGGNNIDGRMPIISEFTKDNTLEHNIQILKEELEGGNGIYIDNKEVSSWYDNDGIHINYGKSAFGGLVFSWEEIRDRIKTLIEERRYSTQIEQQEILEYEIKKVAQETAYLEQDLSDEAREKGYLKEFRGERSIYPDKTNSIIEKLKDKDKRDVLIHDFDVFYESLIEDRSLLRFHYHKLPKIQEHLHDLLRPRTLIRSELDDIKPLEKQFITDDERNYVLSKGNNFTQGKFRIYEQFKYSSSVSDGAKFLKNEYGIGGSTHALKGSISSGKDFDYKGLKISKAFCESVLLSWNEVASLTLNLINKEEYFSEKEWGEYTAYVAEKELKSSLLTDEVKDTLESEKEVTDVADFEEEIEEAIEETTAEEIDFVEVEETIGFDEIIDPEQIFMEQELQKEESKKDLIAAKVGYNFILIPRAYLTLAELSNDNIKVEVDGKEYEVYSGKTFEDSQRIEFFMDSGNYTEYMLNDYIKEESIDLNVSKEASDDVDYSLLLGESFEKDGKTYEIKEIDGDRIELNLKSNNSLLDVVFPVGQNIVSFISDYEDELNAIYSKIEAKNENFNLSNDDLNTVNAEDIAIKKEHKAEITVGSIIEGFEKEPYIVNSIERNTLSITISPYEDKDKIVVDARSRKTIHFADINELNEFLDNAIFYDFDKTKEIEKEENVKFEVGELELEDAQMDYSFKPSEKLQGNIDAITVLKSLERENRAATDSEKEILKKYVGWGGLSNAFDESKTGQWERARNYLKEFLTPIEYEKARESTLTSFYTPPVVIDSIYEVLKNAGFKKGNILEPCCGVGNFISRKPNEFAESKFYGVELDSLSGKIAQKIYDTENIQVKGFEETSFSNNFFDIAVGNVPFGDFKVNDRAYNKQNFMIHDYFFAKTIDKVRPSGIIAFITSSGTLDKKSESVRKYIAARAEFLGAIRLPNNTFNSAGTEVTSDIIFLKKKELVIEQDEPWIHLDTDENGYTYNKYFVDNPNMVLGEMKEVSSRFGLSLTCEAIETPLEELLEKASKEISANVSYEEVEVIESEDVESIPATDDVRNFSFTVVDDDIYYRENSVLIKQDLNDKKKEKVKDYINLTEVLRNVITVQKEDYSEEEVRKSQEALNDVYDTFVKKHGHINDKMNERLFREDANFPLLSSIEVLNDDGEFVEKASIFTRRTIAKAKVIEHTDDPIKALIVSVSQRGLVDLEYMSELTDMSREELINQLKGEIFLDIRREISITEPIDLTSGYLNMPFRNGLNSDNRNIQYVSKDEYLSGDIRQKIKIVDSYIARLERLRSYQLSDFDEEKLKEIEEVIDFEMENLNFQRKNLEEAMPPELDASEISVMLGATWIPPHYIEKFMYELLDTSYWGRREIRVEFDKLTGSWYISKKSYDSANDKANMTYGTDRKNAYEILEATLNLKQITINDKFFDENDKPYYVPNKKETMLVNQKQELIKEEFKNWIFADQDRRHELVKLYNEEFNSIRNREFDGSNLTFDGMNTDITLHEHQRNAIARALYGGNTLLAHVVGAGKTFEMVATAMESKRLGLCNKSLFVVPNHLTGQMGKEFMQLYPSANILVADKKDFEPKRRKRFVSRIATGEYDAIIIGHSQFEKIPMSKEYQVKHINDQIHDIVNSLAQLKNERGQNYSVKQAEKAKKDLEARLERLHDDSKKDNVITFEELGVDKLFIDEAHNYKNLYFTTKMSNVAGINQNEAFKSSDLFMKCQYLDEVTDNKGVVFATGTPVSNSMTELYTMQRYLQYDYLKSKNLDNFDAWASTFGETVNTMELSPEGTGYRTRTRFAHFFNVPELMGMFKEVADIKTADVLDLDVPTAHYEVVKTMPSDVQKNILKSLAERADKCRNGSIDPTEDNMLRITGDGKKLALDQRLIDDTLPDVENSKVNVCINNIYKIWKKTSEDRLTQLVFSDMSTPKNDGSFNIYDDIRNKLVLRGVPKEEIAFIHEANTDKKKEALFSKVRKGEVRILLGSTQKMGAGTNVQNKLIAIHDLDVPWRPADLEQRAGRIVRQGNDNKDVYIYRYITESTFDAYLWQLIECKQKYISQIMTNKVPVRVIDDMDDVTLDYAEIKALATGNPLIKEKMELDNEVTRLKMLEASYKNNLYRLEDKVSISYPAQIKRLEKEIDGVKKDLELIEPKISSEDGFNTFILNRNQITDKKEAGERLYKEISSIHLAEYIPINAKYRNLEIEVCYDYMQRARLFTLVGNERYVGAFGSSSDGNIIRMDNVIEKIPEKLEKLKADLENTKKQLENAKLELDKPFEKADELKEKLLRLTELNYILNEGSIEDSESEEVGDDRNMEVNEEQLDEAKQLVIAWINHEYDERNSLESFDSMYLDISNVEIAYTTTEDEKHSIHAILNLQESSLLTYVDDVIVEEIQYDSLDELCEMLKASTFSNLVYVDSDDLFEKTGLLIDDDGNFYSDEEKKKEAKALVCLFLNREYGNTYSINDFETGNLNVAEIGLAYTTTPDQKYDIQSILNLEGKVLYTNVDEEKIEEIFFDNYLDLCEFLESVDFDSLVSVDSDSLYEKMELYIDDDGNFTQTNTTLQFSEEYEF